MKKLRILKITLFLSLILFFTLIIQSCFCMFSTLDSDATYCSKLSLCYYVNTPDEMKNLVDQIDTSDIKISIRSYWDRQIGERVQITFKKNALTLSRIHEFFQKKHYSRSDLPDGSVRYKKSSSAEYIISEDYRDIVVLYEHMEY